MEKPRRMIISDYIRFYTVSYKTILSVGFLSRTYVRRSNWGKKAHFSFAPRVSTRDMMIWKHYKWKSMLCEQSRGKSLLELWVTTFLHD